MVIDGNSPLSGLGKGTGQKRAFIVVVVVHRAAF
jgi:hypothetical protein